MIGRIRTIKPAFFTHGLLYDLEQLTKLPIRVAYAGLWCWTDRECRFEWKPRELKTGILPHDAVDFAQVLNVLANAGFIVKYMAEGRAYGWVPRFLDHQNINGREMGSTLPPPPPLAMRLYEAALLKSEFHTLTASALLSEPDIAGVAVSASFDKELQRRSRVDDASSTRGSPDTLGRKGKERKGKERKGVTACAAGEAGSDDPAPPDEPTEPDRASASPAAPRTPSVPDSPQIGVQGLTRDRGSHGEGSEGTVGMPESAGGPIGVPGTEVPGSAVVVHDGSRNVPALPALRGPRNAAAIRDRIGLVFGEIAEGSRSRMKREQLAKLQAEVVFLYWTAKFQHPGAILDPKREQRIIARLTENGGDVGELLYALDGGARDDYLMGRTERSDKVFDGIETLLRDRAQVEKLAQLTKGYRAGTPHKALAELTKAVQEHNDPEVT